ncbi:cytochrome c-type biogenesis protein [Pseudooceanicola onchidii]|uniref:cytochrome c-type biogenesis protein n=1 Tax=Pseudooceanicola onchidii TaxID=2562279 RepID=UPI0010AA3C67|nr:cytochrome c-type biogenesis protein [Pseudooceanicola onchidii]
MVREIKHPTALALLIALATTPAMAVQPDEILADPALEHRAREISKELRCLVCRNENIDDSNADLARDLRLLVRERLTEGDTDDEVIDFVVDRYGEYVLLNPTTRGSNWVLWAAGPAMLALALLIGGLFLRRRAAAPEQELSEEEEDRLRQILDR